MTPRNPSWPNLPRLWQKHDREVADLVARLQARSAGPENAADAMNGHTPTDDPGPGDAA